MVNPVNSTDDYSSKKLTVKYFFGVDNKINKGIMYDDDGKTFGTYEQGKYELLEFSTNDNKHFIFISKGHFCGISEKRKITFEVIDGKGVKTKKIKLKNGKTVKFSVNY